MKELKKLECYVVQDEFENDRGEVKSYLQVKVNLGDEEFILKPKESQKQLFKYLLKQEVK